MVQIPVQQMREPPENRQGVPLAPDTAVEITRSPATSAVSTLVVCGVSWHGSQASLESASRGKVTFNEERSDRTSPILEHISQRPPGGSHGGNRARQTNLA